MKTSNSFKCLLMGFASILSVFTFFSVTSCSDDDNNNEEKVVESVVGLWKTEYTGESADGVYSIVDYLLFKEDETGAFVTLSKYDTVVDLILWNQKDTLITISPVVEDEDFISDNAFTFKNGKLSLSWEEDDDIITEEYECTTDDIEAIIASASNKE